MTSIPQPYYGIAKFLALAVTGYLLYIIPRSMALKKQFRLKEKTGKWIFRDSKLKKRRFSRWYDTYIFLNSCWLKLKEWLREPRKKELEYDYLSIFRYLLIIVFSIAAIAVILWLLREYVTSIF